MNESLQSLIEAIDVLESKIGNALPIRQDNAQEIESLQLENQELKLKLDKLQKDYQILKETSNDVMNELNNSIEVIEDYFKKENANNKNTKS